MEAEEDINYLQAYTFGCLCARESLAPEGGGIEQLGREPAAAPRTVRARRREHDRSGVRVRESRREAEIREARIAVVRDQDIRSAQVAVNDVHGMQIIEPLCDFEQLACGCRLYMCIS